jgi:short-subunit dehydrogenase
VTDRPFLDAYGPWAVVAGAGAGLGAAYARQLAGRGLSVLLVDRDAEAVRDLAGSLRDDLAVEADTLVVDLGSDDAVDAVLSAIGDRDVGLLVANAAASHVGPFRDQDPATFEVQLRVNALTPTALVHRLIPRLAVRDRAGIVIMSSLSSRRGAPLVATYAATKAYLAVLAESLWDELRDDGIDVLGVLPGSVRTPGWLSSEPQHSAGTAGVMEPDDVVAEVLDVLGTGQPLLVAGQGNRDSEAFLETLDRAEAVRLVGQVMRDTYPRERQADPTV